MHFSHCPLLNISECLPIEGASKVLTLVYNPLPRQVSAWIRIPVVGNAYKVYEDSEVIPSDYSQVTVETRVIPERESTADYELTFKADLPPLGFKLYTLDELSSSKIATKPYQVKYSKPRGSPFVIENDQLLLEFDGQGNMIMVKNKQSGLSSQISQAFCIYKSMPGNNSEPEFSASGAYVFRPLTNQCDRQVVYDYLVSKHSQYVEIHQRYGEWISQTIRLYNGESNAEFEWQVGPIDVSDGTGREIVTRFDSDLMSNSLFYTDSNGREILQRKRNFRPTWPFINSESVSGNYFPINSRIYLRDEPSSGSSR
jgi:lysosomal alpha-mannosidase